MRRADRGKREEFAATASVFRELFNLSNALLIYGSPRSGCSQCAPLSFRVRRNTSSDECFVPIALPSAPIL
jgi:hypothetical protein